MTLPELDDSDMRDKAQQVQRLAAEAEAEAVSENGAVRVVVGPGGSIKDIDLQLSAFQMSGVELGEMIVEVIREATQKVERELNEEISRLLGMEFASGPLGDLPETGGEGQR